MINYTGTNTNLANIVDMYNQLLLHFNNSQIPNNLKRTTFKRFEELLIDDIVSQSAVPTTRYTDVVWYNANKARLVNEIENLIQISQDIGNIIINEQTQNLYNVLNRQVNWMPYLGYQRDEVVTGLTGAVLAPINMIFHPVQTVVDTAKGVRHLVLHPRTSAEALANAVWQHPVRTAASIGGGIVVGKVINSGWSKLTSKSQQMSAQVTNQTNDLKVVVENAEKSLKSIEMIEQTAILDHATKTKELALKSTEAVNLANEHLQKTRAAMNALNEANSAQNINQITNPLFIKQPAINVMNKVTTPLSSFNKANYTTLKELKILEEANQITNTIANQTANAKHLVNQATKAADLASKATEAVGAAKQSVQISELTMKAAQAEKVMRANEFAQQSAKLAEMSAKATKVTNDTKAILMATKMTGKAVNASQSILQMNEFKKTEDEMLTASDVLNVCYQASVINPDVAKFLACLDDYQVEKDKTLLPTSAEPAVQFNEDTKKFLKLIEEIEAFKSNENTIRCQA